MYTMFNHQRLTCGSTVTFAAFADNAEDTVSLGISICRKRECYRKKRGNEIALERARVNPIASYERVPNVKFHNQFNDVITRLMEIIDSKLLFQLIDTEVGTNDEGKKQREYARIQLQRYVDEIIENFTEVEV